MSETSATGDSEVFVTAVPEGLAAQIEQILQRKSSVREELQSVIDEVRNLRDEDGPLVQFPTNFEELVQQLSHALPSEVEKQKNAEAEKLQAELDKIRKLDELLLSKEKKGRQVSATGSSSSKTRSTDTLASATGRSAQPPSTPDALHSDAASTATTNQSLLSQISSRSRLSVEEEERVEQLMNEDESEQLNSSVFLPMGVDADLLHDIDEKLKDLMEPAAYEQMMATERSNRSIVSAASVRTAATAEGAPRDYLQEQRQERERREQLRILDKIDEALVRLHTDTTPVNSETIQQLIQQCQAEQSRIDSALASGDVSLSLDTNDLSIISHRPSSP